MAPARVTPIPVSLPTAAELGLVFPAGIDVTPLATGTIDSLPPDATLLRLERVTVPGGEDLATRTPAASELLFGELGTVTIVDAFGLSAPLASGGQATLTAGSGYTLRNTSPGPATLLRLSIGTQPSSDPAAQVLLESQLPTLPPTPAALVLALSTWQPGADTGPFTAAGPIGLLLNSGTLTITSPSGLEAPLGPGQGLVFPSGVSQRERNAGSEPAQALLVSVAPMGQPVVAAVPTPTPVPTVTPIPTATSVPTATPEPTATPLPTAIPEPTATPLPTVTPEPTATSTPAPTPTPLPASGTVVYQADPSGGFDDWQLGAGWKLLNSMLVHDGTGTSWAWPPYEPGALADYAVRAEVQILEEVTADNGFGIGVRSGDEGELVGYSGAVAGCGGCFPQAWIYGPDDDLARTEFDPGTDWHLYQMEVRGNVIEFSIDGSPVLEVGDNRFLEGGTVGVWSRNLQINVRSFTVTSLAESAAQGDVVDESVAVTSGLGGQSLVAMLPTTNDAPPGLTFSGEQQRSLNEVVQAYANPEEVVQLFQEWGWQENAYREFAPPNGIPLSPTDLDFARVGIHRFGGVSQSAAAADYIAQDVVAGTGGEGGPGPAIGDGSILLSGQNENGNWVNLIVYQGPYVISISMSTPQGDPSAAALAMAEAVLANENQSTDGSSEDNTEQLTMEPLAVSLAFAAEDWWGGLYRGNGNWYGRPWVAVYGARSDHPVAKLDFALDAAPTEEATLMLTGLDDELPANTTIEVAVNGVPIYTGPSLFANWDGNMDNQGVDASWEQMNFTIPAGLLVAGANELAVSNLEPTANFSEPPWVLLGDAVLQTG